MTKVSDMLADFAHPLGFSGRDVPEERAEYLAAEMRSMLEAIYRWSCVVDPEEVCAAWEHLNAMERAAWTRCVQARGRPLGSD